MQRPSFDHEEIYAPMMDVTTFRFLINLVVIEKLSMCLMNVVMAYLYTSLSVYTLKSLNDIKCLKHIII